MCYYALTPHHSNLTIQYTPLYRSLWRAKLHPLTPGTVLDEDDVRRLTRGIKDALRAGIARQGATLRDYARPDGGSGSMQHKFRSEEHTSELQSPMYLVCRLLFEKT